MRTGHLIEEECFPHMLLRQLHDGLARPLERSHSFNTSSKARALEELEQGHTADVLVPL